jgi:hypothetical protein
LNVEDQLKENGMDGTCSTHGEIINMIQNSNKTPKGSNDGAICSIPEIGISPFYRTHQYRYFHLKTAADLFWNFKRWMKSRRTAVLYKIARKSEGRRPLDRLGSR